MRTITRTSRTSKSAQSAPAVEAKLHWLSDWTSLVLLLLFSSATLVQAYVVPSGSMMNTVLTGDRVIVDKLVYAPGTLPLLPYKDVERGDIIVFRYPLNLKENYVKRAIGIPGDRLRFEDKQLILNGRRVEEPYVVRVPGGGSAYLNNFPQLPDIPIYRRGMEMLRDHVVNGELVVPPGHYLAMGDNRDNSSDSRVWGLVPRESIIGKPVLIYWSHENGRVRLERFFRLLRGYPLN